MSNKDESIDVLTKAMRRCCALYNQLVSEHTRLRKLESHDPPTESCIRRVNGNAQILTADKAIVFDEAKKNEQAIVIHEVEHDFLAAIRATKEAISHPSLASAIEPVVDKPAQWLAELLGEIKSMELAALWPYPRDDDPPQTNTLTPEDRMAALIVVQQRLNHLDCSQEVGARPTPAEAERSDEARAALQLPSKEAMMAWRLRALKGQTQQGIADEMTRQLNRKVKQPAVSNWLKEADEFLLAGGVFPKLPMMPQAPISVDPTVIEMGERVDGRSKHQREQRDADDD